MEKFDTLFEGVLLRNKYEVFDKLIFAALALIGDIKIANEADEFIEFEVQFNGKAIKVLNEYAEDFYIFKAKSVISLRIDYFLFSFYKKRYRVSKKNLFSDLIKPGMLKKLNSILRRDFNYQYIEFGLLSKDLFILIISFLDNYSILNLPACCLLFNKFLKKNNNWRELYFKRHFSCEYNKEGLDWKKVFLTKKKLTYIKELVDTSNETEIIKNRK